MPQKYFPNILLISGTGRNVGKTAFACSVIKHIAKTSLVIGIKISPNKHVLSEGLKVLKQSSEYVVAEEKNLSTQKDTSRMLKAGAKKVYYIQARDDSLKSVLKDIPELSDSNIPIVCESGALRFILTPGLFFRISQSGKIQYKPSSLSSKTIADKWIDMNGTSFDFSPG